MPSAQWYGYATDAISDLGKHWNACLSDLLITEYVEGTGYNKSIEIYNGTPNAIELGANGGYQLRVYANGSPTVHTIVQLSGMIYPGGSFVVANPAANATILAAAQQLANLAFNGDDAVVLTKTPTAAVTVVDAIGQVGVPVPEWGTGDTSTLDNTIRRSAGVCIGDANTSDTFFPATEWTGLPVDSSLGLRNHIHTAACSVY